MIKNYLKDEEFLKTIDNLKIEERFIKIIVLDWEENPIQEIQGITTGGTINLDGNSAMRRTANISFVIKNDNDFNLENVENLISINKKIKLEIGIKNKSSMYKEEEIIWFPQGLFIVNNPNISYSSQGLNVNLNLKDKMCLLDGSCGGKIPATTIFSEYETLNEKGEYVIQYPTLVQIIREVVNHFGGEQLGKILISDLDTRIKRVMKWTGKIPVYLIKDNDAYKLSTDARDTFDKEFWKFEYGEDIGYIYDDFIYMGELICNAGDSVCTILDKIKSYLGNFEYFYDIYGNFVFREIKNYLNNSKAKIDLLKMKESNYLITENNGKSIYSFDESNLITSYSNAPQYNMIKNDFVVWGQRKNANGTEVKLRYHLAIDEKPKIGNIYNCYFYTDPLDKLTKAKLPIIMESFEDEIGAEGNIYQIFGQDTIYEWSPKEEKFIPTSIKLDRIKTTDWRTELYLQGVQSEPFGIESNYYYTELVTEWPKIYNLKANYIEEEKCYIGEYYNEYLKTPSNMDFYLDFIDSGSVAGDLQIKNIGRRTEIISDSDVNCVFEPDIPDFVIIETGTSETKKKREECEDRGQDYIQTNTTIYNTLGCGGSQNSAYDKIRSLLHQYTSYNESINISSNPIYHLEPNTRISVKNKESNIYGDFMIKTISIPLDLNGTMSITASRALEKI